MSETHLESGVATEINLILIIWAEQKGLMFEDSHKDGKVLCDLGVDGAPGVTESLALHWYLKADAANFNTQGGDKVPFRCLSH